MSVKKLNAHDLSDPEQQKIGRINNDRIPGFRRRLLAGTGKIGRTNNEQGPHLQREILPEERVIGVINNEKRD